MNLRTLSAGLIIKDSGGNLDVDIRKIHCDSRKVRPGDLFAVIVDMYRDGRTYIQNAIDAGAIALLVSENPGEVSVPWIRVPQVAAAMGPMCAKLLGGEPALELIGVTGTNGKTTTCHLLEAILLTAGRIPGFVGTTAGARYAGKTVSTGLTTPEAPELHELFADMRENGVNSVAMEVSSHGIALKRVEGCDFTVGVLTGIGSDHLDFHGDHTNYVETKVNWLLGEVQANPACKGVVVPNDDDGGLEVLSEFRKKILTFGPDDSADIYPDQIDMSPSGTRGRIATPVGTLTLDVRLPGRHNVRNAMAAIGAALLLDVEPIAIVDGLMRVSGVPGRLQGIPNERGIHVVVDYAHTPDALETALASLRELSSGRLIVVFGCGGDRDRAKRPKMGAIAYNGADLIVMTSDNPRNEDPGAILDEIVLGLPVDADPSNFVVEVDRRQAIQYAVQQAAAGDTVLIAGKGHEVGQVVGDVVNPFDDRVVAAEALA